MICVFLFSSTFLDNMNRYEAVFAFFGVFFFFSSYKKLLVIGRYCFSMLYSSSDFPSSSRIRLQRMHKEIIFG